MARHISERCLQPTVYLCHQGSQRRGGKHSISQVRQKYTRSSSHKSVPTDLWVFFQRVRIYPFHRLHTGFHLLETTWRPSHTSEPRSGHSLAFCLLDTGRLQCMAILDFVQGYGVNQRYDARRLPADPERSPNHHRCEWNRPRRCNSDQSWKQAARGCTLRRCRFRCEF